MGAFCSAGRPKHREDSPSSTRPLRLGELVATLALAQDNAFGQPLESQLRSCLLASWMCEAAGLDEELRDDRLLGGAAPVHRLHRPRPRGLDPLRRRDRDPRADARPRLGQSRGGDARHRGLRDRRPRPRRSGTRSSGRSRRRSASGRSSTSRPDARSPTCSSSGWTSTRTFARRSRCTFECWNGNGHPNHVQGEAIPLPMRIVHVSHDMEALGRLFSPERALEAAQERRDETYDPAVADLFLAHGRDWFDRLARDRALGRRARPRARAAPSPDGRRARRRPHRRRPTSSTSSRRTGAGTAAAARSSPRTRPACSGSTTRR